MAVASRDGFPDSAGEGRASTRFRLRPECFAAGKSSVHGGAANGAREFGDFLGQMFCVWGVSLGEADRTAAVPAAVAAEHENLEEA
jgi:hypothetical protein